MSTEYQEKRNEFFAKNKIANLSEKQLLEFDEKVRNKLSELGNLITLEACFTIISTELKLLNFKKPTFTDNDIKSHFDISECFDESFQPLLMSSWRKYIAYISEIYPLRTFDRNDGSSGYLRKIKVSSVDNPNLWIFVNIWKQIEDKDLTFKVNDKIILKGFILKSNDYQSKTYFQLHSGNYSDVRTFL